MMLPLISESFSLRIFACNYTRLPQGGSSALDTVAIEKLGFRYVQLRDYHAFKFIWHILKLID